MSLHNLCRFGLLTKETTLILQNLNNDINFRNIESKLNEYGYTSSKSHAIRIKSEIKSRIYPERQFLPKIDSLITMAKMNFHSIIKAQIYFVYLYTTDIFVSHVTDKLGEIFHSNYDNSEISRDSIKNLLITHLNTKLMKEQKKTIENWIGRFLSIMREIKILNRKRKHNYLINFNAILPETWNFFALDSYFNDYSLLESEFFRAYQLKPKNLSMLLKKLRETNSNIHTKLINDSVKIETSFNSIKEWIVNIK